MASTHYSQHISLHPAYPFIITEEEKSWKKKLGREIASLSSEKAFLSALFLSTDSKTLRIVLPHVGLVTFCVIYVLAGAWLFFFIESSEEERMRKQASEEIRAEQYRLMIALWEIQRTNRSAWEESALRHLDSANRVLINWFQKHYTIDNQLTWSYPTAIFFCISMITTIGVSGPLPVSALLLLMVAYMMIGAVLLHSYEKWTFGQAFYWAFISMSSIGFGDIVPERTEMFPITIAYILIGLALASMCIDTSAAYYIRKIHFFGRKMKSAQATVSDLIRLSSALKHMLVACNAYVPEDINLIYYIDHPSSVFAPFEESEEIHIVDDDPSLDKQMHSAAFSRDDSVIRDIRT
uniref:Potassium channel domain-containing protein n=1 Tax=Parascaris univalens TaxID=6257 RepID=A0A915ACP8_PARUN